MAARSLEDRRQAADAYKFRAIHPHVRFGTASDRYGGWIGQIYPEETYGNQISTRTRTLNGQSFEERRVPVESVRHYFQHFEVLELDFTFYRPLLDAEGTRSSNYHVLTRYAKSAPADASFFLKAPRKVFARRLRRGGSYVENEDFLNAEEYARTFHEPAVEILGNRLDGIIFEQEYQRVAHSPTPETNVRQLDRFFSNIPGSVQSHIELRSEHLLNDAYFEWLGRNGLGFVFSHWTWLPRLKEQWDRCSRRFTAEDGQVVARLLTPRNMKYAEAFAKTHPFDETNPDLRSKDQAEEMVLDTTALAYQAQAQDARLNMFANNRAWGNAPRLCQALAHRILDEEERREAGDD